MKKGLKTFLVLALFFSSSAVLAQGANFEQIHSYQTVFEVRQDSTLNVTETINYDFGTLRRHGIFRDIPVSYETSFGRYSTKISDISVKDESGNPYTFSLANKGDEKEIKIGNGSIFITGAHTYVIHYTLSGAIGFFKDFDELYWNAVGTDWKVPIGSVRAEVVLPKKLAQKTLQTSCYQGASGSTATCSISNGSGETDRIIFSGGRLAPHEAFTIAVGFPKGVVQEPSKLSKISGFVADNWIVLIPILVFIFCFWNWYKNGRDPKGRGVIIPQYEAPDGLTPLEIGSILQSTKAKNAPSAEIIFLATLGYLSIERVETKGFLSIGTNVDYKLIRSGKDDSALQDFDKKLLSGLFNGKTEVMISSLRNKFYLVVNSIVGMVSRTLFEKGYFDKNPAEITKKYIRGIGSLVGIFVLSRAYSMFVAPIGSVMYFSFGIAVAIYTIFAFLMTRVTVKGAETKEYIQGFKEYLQIAEKDRLAFHNAPEKKPELFEKLLPYAIVLGVEDAWAKEFQDIYTTPPSWYHGTGQFNTLMLTRHLNNFSTATTRVSHAPGSHSGSRGGGFSGGGGGGGGGGSW